MKAGTAWGPRCVAAGFLVGLFGILIIGGPAIGARSGPSPEPRFDPAALQRELARPLPELKQQGPDALQAHMHRLTDFYEALDLAEEVSAEERRVLSDKILARAAQAGLLLRAGRVGLVPEGRGRDATRQTIGLGFLDDAIGLLRDDSIVLVGLLGGLIVAFSVGSVVGYRRGANQASYYGEGDPRIRFVTRDRERREPTGQQPRITLDQIREALLAGRTVLMQLGYEVVPERRAEYLGLMREMHRILGVADGQTYSVWEDPRHPNRFYELLACRRLWALDRLTTSQGELPDLAARIERCRMPGRPVLRRAWWEIQPQPTQAAARVSPADQVSTRERGR